jgi:hypothetical protein
MELTQRHNQPATRLGRRPAQAGVAAPALFALGVAVITWAEWDYMRGLATRTASTSPRSTSAQSCLPRPESRKHAKSRMVASAVSMV